MIELSTELTDFPSGHLNIFSFISVKICVIRGSFFLFLTPATNPQCDVAKTAGLLVKCDHL
jgi:hypothetical protein